MRLVTLKEASEYFGISVVSLRRRIYSGTIPYTRSNADRTGKILLEIELVQRVLRNEALNNMQAFEDTTESKDSLIAFDDLDDKEQPTSMANINKLWGPITQADVDARRFAADTLALKPSDNPTSETLRTDKAPKKP